MLMAPPGKRPAPPIGVARLAISGQQNLAPWTNVFYLRLTDDGVKTQADLGSVVDAIMTAWAAGPKGQHATDIVTTDAKAVWITDVDQAYEYVKSVSQAGTNGTGVQDNSACAVVNWAINRYYRGGHPRTYHPGVPAGNISSGATLTAAFQTALAAAYSSWMNTVNGLTATHITKVELGTVSFANGNVWRNPPVFFPYKSVGVRNYLGTQRRRIGGR